MLWNLSRKLYRYILASSDTQSFDHLSGWDNHNSNDDEDVDDEPAYANVDEYRQTTHNQKKYWI